MNYNSVSWEHLLLIIEMLNNAPESQVGANTKSLLEMKNIERKSKDELYLYIKNVLAYQYDIDKELKQFCLDI